MSFQHTASKSKIASLRVRGKIYPVYKEKREKKQDHRGMVFWLTGMSGAGKSTLAHIAEA